MLIKYLRIFIYNNYVIYKYFLCLLFLAKIILDYKVSGCIYKFCF